MPIAGILICEDNRNMTLKELIAEAHSIVPKISCESFAKDPDSFIVIDVGKEQRSLKLEAFLMPSIYQEV